MSQRAHSLHLHVIHDVTCLSVGCFLVLSSSSLSRASIFSPKSTSTMSKPPSTKSTAHPQNEEYCSVAVHNPLTGYEPNQLDNSDYSETFAVIFQNESFDIDTEPSYSCDAELDDGLIGKAVSSPLFTHEREETANLRQTYHSPEESLLPAQSFFTRTSTRRPVYEPSSDLSQNENQVATWKTSKSGFSWKVRSEIQKHELQAESDKEVSRN